MSESAAELTLPYSRPLSHPPEKGEPESTGTPLRQHLSEVGDRAASMLERGGASESFADTARVLGQLHDFGKVTPFFQRYIDKHPPKRDSFRYHSPLGAFATFLVLDDCGYDTETAILGLFAVAKHHGRLDNVLDYVLEEALDESREIMFDAQVDGIDAKTAAWAGDFLNEASDGVVSWEYFAEQYRSGELVERIRDAITYYGEPDPEALSDRAYESFLQLWSALTVADKTSAAGLPERTLDSPQLDPDVLDEHVHGLLREAHEDGVGADTHELNGYREQARRNAIANAKDFATSSGNLAQITLPTGVGKTITGTGTGLTISNIRDLNGRLIYILPYTSIIDQTVNEFETIFDIDAFGDLLTIHHHLSETVTSVDTSSSEDKHASREYLLGETWNAASVVSTYVQLFETLVKPTSQSSIKLPSLYNSTIILDEPQTLPLKWWPLIRRVVETLIEEYNATVISMTATQPRLFTSERCRFDVVDLIDEPDQYFEAVERVEYKLDHSVQAFLEDGEDAPQLGHQEAAARLLAGVRGEESSALSICNTIDSATQLSQNLSMEIGGCGRTEIAIGDLFAEMAAEGNYDAEDLKGRVFSRLTGPEVEDPIVTLTLTTRHRPIDRQAMLDVATDLSTNTNVPFIFVATQLVEAGVDVSFSRVYRDIAPITSIVQAAGRCNRSAELERGTVTVWRLEPTDMSLEEPTPPSELVYGAGGENDEYGTLHPTVRAIDHVLDEAGETSAGMIPEVTLAHNAVAEFYRILDTEKNVGKERWVGWVNDAKFGELRELSLIEEKDEHDTIVCRSPEEAEQGRELLDLLGEPDPSNAALKQSRELMETLDRCRVSIPENKVEGAGPLHGKPVDLGYGVAFVVFDSDGKGRYSPRYGLQQ